MRKLATSLIVVLVSANMALGANILFVGGQPDAAQGDDIFVLDHLEELGHTVDYLTGDESSSGDVDGMDLLIISSTLGSGSARGKFQDSEIPIMQWEEALIRWDHDAADGNFRMSEFSRNGGGRETTVINIVNSEHPLAAGLEGEVEIFDDLNRTPQSFGEPAPGLIIIAELDPEFVEDEENPEWVLTAIDKGGELGPEGEGFFAADKRVNFPIEDVGFSFLNDNGLALFNASIDWLLGEGGNGITGDFDGNGMLELADLNLLSDAIAANDATFDLTGDGAVNGEDLAFFAVDLKNSYVGDANLDGEFNSGDFVTTFTAGKYETGEAANWGQGDWTGDGLFTSGDFVAAFSGGGYELGPRAATAAVPEPSSSLLVLLGAISLLGIRRK